MGLRDVHEELGPGPVSYNPSTGQVQFTVTQPGTYVISIKYNPSALQGTP